MARRFTLKVAKDTCAAYGISLTKRDGEYRLAPRYTGGSRNAALARAEASAYYTNNLQDAVGTCRVWNYKKSGDPRIFRGLRRKKNRSR